MIESHPCPGEDLDVAGASGKGDGELEFQSCLEGGGCYFFISREAEREREGEKKRRRKGEGGGGRGEGEGEFQLGLQAICVNGDGEL